jgi:hypothetical protein
MQSNKESTPAMAKNSHEAIELLKKIETIRNIAYKSKMPIELLIPAKKNVLYRQFNKFIN